MSSAMITQGKQVADALREGWELWHVSPDALPGRWELRKAYEPSRAVGWDAIERVRNSPNLRAFLDTEIEELQEGRNTWCYRLKQRNLRLPKGKAA